MVFGKIVLSRFARNFKEMLVHPARFELTTSAFGGLRLPSGTIEIVVFLPSYM